MSTVEIVAELPRLTSAELAQVEAKLRELVQPARAEAPVGPIAAHPALGIWKDRTDLPEDPAEDSIEASRLLRGRMMRRTDRV